MKSNKQTWGDCQRALWLFSQPTISQSHGICHFPQMERQPEQTYTAQMPGSAMQLCEAIFVKLPASSHEFWRGVVALWEVGSSYLFHRETMLSLIGTVASSMPRMGLTIFFFSHFYLNHLTVGLVYEVSLTEREQGQGQFGNYSDGWVSVIKPSGE